MTLRNGLKNLLKKQFSKITCGSLDHSSHEKNLPFWKTDFSEEEPADQFRRRIALRVEEKKKGGEGESFCASTN